VGRCVGVDGDVATQWFLGEGNGVGMSWADAPGLKATSPRNGGRVKVADRLDRG